MEINIKFLVIAYFVSMFVDWVFQWKWQATNKSKWDLKNILGSLETSGVALISHSLIYSLLVSIILTFIFGYSNSWTLIYWTLFLSHIIIDSRIPVKWIMRFKGLSKEEINDYQNYGFMHIGIDHRLHELVLLILSMFIR